MPWMEATFHSWKQHTEQSKELLRLTFEGSTDSFATYLDQQLRARKEEGKFTTFCNTIERKLNKFSDENIIPLIVLDRGTSEQMMSKLTPSAVRHLEKLAESMTSDRFISEALMLRKNKLAVTLAVRVPSGRRLSRRFRDVDAVAAVAAFVAAETGVDMSRHALVAAFPRRPLSDLGRTLKDAGVKD